MPEVSIKEQIKSMNTFYDVTYYYRRIGKCVFGGYVPFETVTGFQGDYPIFEPYAYYSEFRIKGKLYRRKSLNLPLTMGKYIVNNMYAEYPDIVLSKDDDKTDSEESENKLDNERKRLLEILDDNQFFIKEKNLFETQLHIGDRVLKPYIVDSKIKIDYITGERFFATHVDNNKVISGVFATFKELTKGRKVEHYTRLEWHYDINDEREVTDAPIIGRIIKTELYKGDEKGKLTTRCNFDRLYEVFGDLIEERIEILGLDTPTFILITNPQQNNKDLIDGRGIGFAVNYLDQFMSIDEAYDGKSNDNVAGRMKTIVGEVASEQTIDSDGNTHKHYDPYDPTVLVHNAEGMADGTPQAFAPPLRTQNYIESSNVDIDYVSASVGMTTGTFRHDGKSIITATQVRSEDSESARTIREYETNSTLGWQNLFMLIKFYNNEKVKGAEKFTFEKDNIDIIWKDNIIIDDQTEKEDDLKLVDLEMMSKTRWLMTHKGLSDIEAKEWVKEAREEQKELFDGDTDDMNNIGNNPTPNEGESKDDFMKRCVPEVMGEGKDNDQAIAICNTKFGD